MKLGDVVQISIGVSDLAASLQFYDTLGFSKVAQNTAPWPWTQLSDGQHLFLLNQDGNQYLGLNYFSTAVSQTVATLEEKGFNFVHKQEQDGRLSRAIFTATNGVMIGLINQDPTNMHDPKKNALCLCGKFGEFSLGVADWQTAVSVWQQLGFETLHHSPDPYPWGIISDGNIMIGIHQTDEFEGPLLTYFDKNMPERIQQLKNNNVKFGTHRLAADNPFNEAIILGPDGEEFFLVKGEVL